MSMKKISFTQHVLPHAIAVILFLIVTVFFFKPAFFDNRTLQQHDIQQFMGSSKAIADYRKQTGNEALWTNSMFSGMPAYFISVQWGNVVIGHLKSVLSLGLPHPFANIFLAFLCYYIMLLAFGIRPYLAMAGAIAFGLSSYMIIGLAAGHNSRIGAIAFMPLVMAGIHLAFTNRPIIGFGVTAAGLALQLRENHLQMTYYLLLMVMVYGLVHLILAISEKWVVPFFKTVALLVGAVILAAATFFGPFWAIMEYTPYSIRGKSEITAAKTTDAEKENESGLSKAYAFEYSNSVLEPFTLLIPNFYGGSSGNYLFTDEESETYRALVNSGNQEMANQLIRFSSAYWGEQRVTSPYYAGAIIVFLFAIGIAFADKKYVWWLVPISVFALMLSWGSNFSAFNYFMFDYLPGYNKFRSVTFTLIIILFSMPLLGLLGLEKLLTVGITPEAKRKLLIALSATGGLCLFFWLFAGIFSFTREIEEQLPAWFTDALARDRKSLFRADAFRSLAFILVTFVAIYFDIFRKISAAAFYLFLILLVTIDLAVVSKRYLPNEAYKRKRDNQFFAMTEADREILRDKSYYRVYNLDLQDPFGAMAEAQTSYYHHSVGGYHGAKLRRYQNFYDSCLFPQTRQFFEQAQQGNLDMSNLGAFNMLNIKYIKYGPQKSNIILNDDANGNAWFVQDIVAVGSPTEELEKTCDVNTGTTAVIDTSHFAVPKVGFDSTSDIRLTEYGINRLKYESRSGTNSLAVFSEIYYPKGWIATLDGKEVPILRANFILRALEIPAGTHTIEFRFEPESYTVGNKVTTAASWLVLLVMFGSIGWSVRNSTRSDS